MNDYRMKMSRYHDLLQEKNSLMKKVNSLTKTIRALTLDKEKLQASIKENIEKATTKTTKAFQTVKNICLALNVVQHDNQSPYKLNMNTKQAHLFQAIRTYASNKDEEIGDGSNAYEIRRKMTLTPELEHTIIEVEASDRLKEWKQATKRPTLSNETDYEEEYEDENELEF